MVFALALSRPTPVRPQARGRERGTVAASSEVSGGPGVVAALVSPMSHPTTEHVPGTTNDGGTRIAW